MDRAVKRAIELIFGDTAWIEKATQPQKVLSLIELLRPKMALAPLTRFGGTADGGYLIPDDLEGISGCLSPGVSNECSFDEQVAERGIDVFMADASVDGPPRSHPRFHFVPKFIDISPGEKTVTIEEFAQLSKSGDLLLQMDIEGAEYRVLAETPDELLKRFRIMVIEFHHLDRLFSRFAFESLMRPVFEKLVRHHHVVHIHPNNCTKVLRRGNIVMPPVMEFTFYRKDRPLAAASEPRSFPHPLDADCVPRRPPITLPECWWKGGPS